MGEERAAMVFTDPPYNVPIDGHASGLGAIHHRPFPMASGEMDSAQFTAFLGGAFRNLASFSSDGALHYVFMDWRHIEELLAASRGVYDGSGRGFRFLISRNEESYQGFEMAGRQVDQSPDPAFPHGGQPSPRGVSGTTCRPRPCVSAMPRISPTSSPSITAAS
jgi:hypothetical protein